MSEWDSINEEVWKWCDGEEGALAARAAFDRAIAAARAEGYAQAKEQAAQEAMGGEFPAHLMCDHLKCEGAREAAQRIRAMEPKP